MEDLESVVEAMMNGGDREAQVEATIRIGEFSSKQRHELAERGVIGPLISILRSHGGCEEAIEAALFALLALAFGSERNKIRIVKLGAIPVLLNLLQSRSEAVAELSVAAMLILSSCSANRPEIASSQTVGTLTEIIGRTRHSVQAKLDAISTLQNLTKLGHTVPLIVAQGGVSYLVEFMISSEKSSEAVERAAMLLETVVQSSEDALDETARASGRIRALVEVIEDGTPQGKEHAAAVLLLTCRREGCRELILREGAIPGLLQLSVDGTQRAQATAEKLLLLLRDRDRNSKCRRVAGQISSNKKLCSKAEFVEEIMKEIDSDGEVVVAETLRLVEEMAAKSTRNQHAASSSHFRFAHKVSAMFSLRAKRWS